MAGSHIRPGLHRLAEIEVDPERARIHEHGWQSWSPTLTYPVTEGPICPRDRRAFQHARFWFHDPDCLIGRPEVERRDEWADHVERFGGLRASSDRLADLDPWGLARTRELLANPPSEPFVAS